MESLAKDVGMTFLEFLTEYNIPHLHGGEHHHARAGWTQLDCPFCSPGSGRFRMGYCLAGGFCNCWTCGWHPAVGSLVELTGLPYGRVLEQLDRDYDWEHEESERKSLRLPEGLGDLLGVHQDYLRNRGFNPKEITRLWGVQGIGLAKRLAWRLFIPITKRGAMVSWTTRAVSGSGLRYVSAKPAEESTNHKHCLYGADLARHAVVVVEGPTDAWRVGPGAVATFGTSYTSKQVALISQYPVRVVCYDSDPYAQIQARKLCRALEAFPGSTRRVELNAKDPGEASESEIKELRSFLR